MAETDELIRGWFQIDGVTTGPRTLDEQLLGLEPALAEAKGKTVCDLGTAEGLIALEFAKAGAESVYACDYNEVLIGVAKQREHPQSVTFEHKDVVDLIAEHRASGEQYDIILALALLHKLADPDDGVKFCCEAARSLVVVRLPQGSRGVIRSKSHTHKVCDIRPIFADHWFTCERTESGPRDELVQYWRRT